MVATSKEISVVRAVTSFINIPPIKVTIENREVQHFLFSVDKLPDHFAKRARVLGLDDANHHCAERFYMLCEKSYSSMILFH